MMRESLYGAERPLADLITLKGKSALITGSASGIGKAIATRFANAGADILLVDIDEKKLRAMKEELQKKMATVDYYKVDLSKKEEIDSLWEKFKGREPSILVNNAGIYPMRSFLKIDEAFLDKVLNINLKAVLWMSQNMIRTRNEQGGMIINIGSIEAILPFKKELVHYDMGKAGILGLTRALAKEFSNKGYRINAIIPGGIVTPALEVLLRSFFVVI